MFVPAKLQQLPTRYSHSANCSGMVQNRVVKRTHLPTIMSIQVRPGFDPGPVIEIGQLPVEQ